MAAACFQAAAIDIQLGEGVEAKFRGSVTWGTQIRTESPSPDAYADWPSRAVPGTSKGNLQGQTGGSNLNFAKGQAISNVLKATLNKPSIFLSQTCVTLIFEFCGSMRSPFGPFAGP
jgi:hypothetical protein